MSDESRTWMWLGGVHAALGLLAAVLTLGCRPGQPALRAHLLEFGIALFVPFAGPAAVILQLSFERWLFRRVTPTNPDELLAAPEVECAVVAVDARRELANQASVEPLAEVVRVGDIARAEWIIRRAAQSDDPLALGAIRQALKAPSRDLRVRARSVATRLEGRLVSLLQAAQDPQERARCLWKLAELDGDAAGARRRRAQAVQEFRAAVAQGRTSAAYELGLILQRDGDYAGARAAFSQFLLAHPTEPRGYLARADLLLRMGDVRAVRQDLEVLGGFGPPWADIARRWLPSCTSASSPKGPTPTSRAAWANGPTT